MPLNPFSKKPPAAPATGNPYEKLRADWLGGTMAAAAPPSDRPELPFAVLMELGVGRDVATFVAAEDGTASIYMSTGSGTIGMGFHPSTSAAALALLGCATSYLRLFPKATAFPRPAANRVAFHIVTRAGVQSAQFDGAAAFSDPDIAPLRTAGEHLVTNARLLDNDRAKGGIKPRKMLAHVFPDGGTCLFTEPNPEFTWLTVPQLARVLEIGKARGDSLMVDSEKGVAALQAPALAAIDASGYARTPPPGPGLSLYSGGTTTLHYAAEIARVDLANEQIALGANVEARDNLQYTPLILAAFKNRSAVVHALLDGGADASARDRHGNTVLHFAVQSGDMSTVRRLVEAGADLTARGQNGYTALKVASLCRQAEAASFLASHGAAE